MCFTHCCKECGCALRRGGSRAVLAKYRIFWPSTIIFIFQIRIDRAPRARRGARVINDLFLISAVMSAAGVFLTVVMTAGVLAVAVVVALNVGIVLKLAAEVIAHRTVGIA